MESLQILSAKPVSFIKNGVTRNLYLVTMSNGEKLWDRSFVQGSTHCQVEEVEVNGRKFKNVVGYSSPSIEDKLQAIKTVGVTNPLVI